MRKRDVGILALCCVSVLISLQQDGSVVLKPAFRLGYRQNNALPKPLITDLNADGKNEVILLPEPRQILVYNVPKHIFSLKHTYSQVLNSDCIGLGTGYTTVREHSRKDTRHQIVVAVMADYSVVALDASLKEIWRHDLLEESHSYTPEFSSVLILPHSVHKGDQGMVVIGVNTRQLGGETEGMLHFSYFCLNAADGQLRWKHDGESFHSSEGQDKKASPLQNYKLSAEHIEKHAGEQDWRVFRRSMMSALPHRFTHLHDVTMNVRHFAKRRSQKKEEVTKKAKTVEYRSTERTANSKENFGSLGERITGLKNAVKDKLKESTGKHQNTTHQPNVIVVHRDDGIEVLHLYTGRTLCQVGPLMSNVVYDDVNNDMGFEAIHTTIVNTHQHSLPVHQRRASVRCNGIVETGIPGMHHDVLWNGSICVNNGLLQNLEVLKSIMRSGERGDEGDVSMKLSTWGDKDHTGDALAAATPLVLHRRVSEHVGITRLASYTLFFINTGLVTAVDPHRKSILWQVETDSVFSAVPMEAEEEELMISDDILSLKGVSPHLKNQHNINHFPHLVPYSIHAVHVSLKQNVRAERNALTLRDKPFVIVVGDSMLTVLRSSDGSIEAEADLFSAPVAPLVIGDINSDGTNDILVIARKEYTAYYVHHRGGTSVLTFLIICAMGLLGLMFVTQYKQSIL